MSSVEDQSWLTLKYTYLRKEVKDCNIATWSTPCILSFRVRHFSWPSSALRTARLKLWASSLEFWKCKAVRCPFVSTPVSSKDPFETPLNSRDCNWLEASIVPNRVLEPLEEYFNAVSWCAGITFISKKLGFNRAIYGPIARKWL